MRPLVSFSGGFPPKFYVLGHRVHHGLLGLLWALTDLQDVRYWVSDLRRPVDREERLGMNRAPRGIYRALALLGPRVLSRSEPVGRPPSRIGPRRRA